MSHPLRGCNVNVVEWRRCDDMSQSMWQDVAATKCRSRAARGAPNLIEVPTPSWNFAQGKTAHPLFF